MNVLMLHSVYFLHHVPEPSPLENVKIGCLRSMGEGLGFHRAK